MSRILSIGLTGGIASGKSAVSKGLAEHGAVVIDADCLAREVVSPGTPGLEEVVERFGEEILTDDGSLDRAALGEQVFNDQGAREQLNSIIHPRVREEATKQRREADAGTVVVEDIPLLVETGQQDRFDVVVVVQAPEEQRVQRMVTDRGMSRDEAESRIRAQASDEQRAAAADVVIENAGTLEQLQEKVDQLWDQLSKTYSIPKA